MIYCLCYPNLSWEEIVTTICRNKSNPDLKEPDNPRWRQLCFSTGSQFVETQHCDYKMLFILSFSITFIFREMSIITGYLNKTVSIFQPLLLSKRKGKIVWNFSTYIYEYEYVLQRFVCLRDRLESAFYIECIDDIVQKRTVTPGAKMWQI